VRPLLPALLLAAPAFAADRPNVLIVITDDQGFGDLGAHGNPVLKTPHLDRFTTQSVWLKSFTVSPVCSPTRAALLTGRYNYRTGVVDTFIGRSMMRPGVPTLADYLGSAGYRTGLFGKWHLGDHHPLRPEDRGFQETLWLHGGGLAQPSDPPGQDPKTAYFDPTVTRNGHEETVSGYCTDVFFDAAAKFVSADKSKPFFCYLALNAPHDPFQVPPAFAAAYRGLTLDAFPKVGQPWVTKKLNEKPVADAYGMIANIDANFGKLMTTLDDAGLAGNTIVLFLTDNGPGGVRFNAGLRGRKGTVYDGGIRVPCYARWPARLKAGKVVEQPTAGIDWVPTLVEACGVKTPDIDPGWDGRDLLPLLTGDPKPWPGRTIFSQWHRGDVPEKGRAFAARGPRFKLVQAAGVPEGVKWTPKYELFDMLADPFEQTDLADQLPAEVAKLNGEYEKWFDDVTKLGFDPPRIVVGSDAENPVRLSRQDWRGSKGWGPTDEGQWAIKIAKAGRYRVSVWLPPGADNTWVTVCDATLSFEKPDEAGGPFTVEAELPAGETPVQAWCFVAGKRVGVTHVAFERLGD
jgi:arylsulfatase/arylsulfatase A